MTTKKVLRDLIIEAGDAVGEDGEGKDGILGYIKWLANVHPKVYGGLLGRVLPFEIAMAQQGTEANNVYETPEELAKAMKNKGLPLPERILQSFNVPQTNGKGH